MSNLVPRSSIVRGILVLMLVCYLAFLALFFGFSSSAQEAERKVAPATMRSEQMFGPFDYNLFLDREKNGEFPFAGGDVPVISPYNSLTNNNTGSTATGLFTQSETSIVAFGNTVVVGFNDSGSNSGGTNKFTGFARSTDGGATFTDGGTLPTNPNGDAGDPVMARDEITGRIYFSTLQFSGPGIQVFRSDDNGATWSLPVNGTPGRPAGNQDKEWIAVDNFAGPGNGNVYLVTREFGSGPGIYCFRSTDGGLTFGPSAGVSIVGGSQGAFVAVGPDHAVYVFWFAGATLQVRKSTDQGLTFAPAVTVASGLVGGVNGDLALTGIRQGTTTPSGFRSNEFPHAAVNPVNGNIYVVYANNPAGTDKADIFMTQSTNGGATFAAPVRVNDDATTTDQWQPTLAVTPDGSNIGIFYYSRQEDAANNLFKFYGRNGSISGGTITFTPSYAISDVASLPEFGRDSLINATYMSDYDQAAATSGAFHVVWSDNRNDLPGGGTRKDPNVFYKRINLTLHVTTTVPAAGSTVATQPSSFTVNVSEPVNPATLQAADFSVNGIPATSVSYTPGTTTMQFDFAASPVTAQGLQTMNVAGGAFNSAAAGDPVAAFAGTFRYDVLVLQVESTVPPFPGGVFTLPSPITYDVNFNEPVDPLSVQTGDLQLSGIPGSSVTAVNVLPGNMTARFTLDVPTEGTLTATIPAGAITDPFGNPGAAFSANYVVDIGTVPYPTPLIAKSPFGSLIYDPSISGNIGFAGDVDAFSLSVDPGQTITAIVSGSGGLQSSVSLRDPSDAAIASATAAGANQNALLQTARATTGGTYTFRVSGAGGTTGNFTLQVILNAAKEAEGTIVGATNNTPASAQNIDASFFTVQTSQASGQRGAVNGTTDSANYTATAVPFAFEDIGATGTVITGLTNVDDASVSIPIGFTFPLYGAGNTSVFVSSNGLLTFGTANTSFTNADLTTTPAQATIAGFWDDQHTGGGQPGSKVVFQVSGTGPDQHLTIQWNQIRFFSGGTAGDTLTHQVQLFADGRIQFNYLDLVSGTAAGNNGASATSGIKAAGTQGPDRLLLAFNNGPNAFLGTGKSTLLSPPAPTPDVFSFTMGAGNVTTLGVKSLGSATANIELLDSGGALLASGAAGSTNLDRVISNFAIATGGTYYARVSSAASVPYDFVVTRNAAFDTENNNSSATAQEADGNQGALGSIIDSGIYEAAAIPFVFDDISSTGTVIVGLRNVDDAAVSIPIGFTFNFYGISNTNVFVSSNGLLTFGTANTAFTNADLTTTPAQAAIAPFWDDQHTGGGQAASNVYFEVSGTGSDQHLTIQWNQIRFFSGSTAGDTITHQVQLYADGRIQFNYSDLVSGTAAGNNGASATVGIKAAGNQGPNRLLLAFNNGPNTFVGTGKSTLLTQQPSDDWYSLTLGVGQTEINLETSTPAEGPGEFINTLDPHIELYDPANVLMASGSSLADGRNEGLSATGLAPGIYRVRVTSENLTSGEYFLSFRHFAPQAVGKGSWKNKNGQAIIKSASATDLRNFLIGFNPFKDLNPTANSNDIAAYVASVLDAASAGGNSMNLRLKAEMLITALNVYFSDPALGGNKIGSPVPIGGVHINLTPEVSAAAFGGANCPTVLDMLSYAASQAAPASGANPGASPWYGDLKPTQEAAKNAFETINENQAQVCGP
jgi:hypothetical protein